MSEVTFFDCDAEGCTAAVRMEDADHWYYYHGEYGTIADTEIEEEGIELLVHACCIEHLPSAVFEVAKKQVEGVEEDGLL